MAKPFAALEWRTNRLWAFGPGVGLVVGWIWPQTDNQRSWAFETAGRVVSGAMENEGQARLALELAIRQITQCAS